MSFIVEDGIRSRHPFEEGGETVRHYDGNFPCPAYFQEVVSAKDDPNASPSGLTWVMMTKVFPFSMYLLAF